MGNIRRLATLTESLRWLLGFVVSIMALLASDHHGQVQFGGLPVPGATVTAIQGDRKLSTITDGSGSYIFSNLPDGTWTIEIEMLCFAPLKREVTVGKASPEPKFELKLLSIDDIKSAAVPAPPASAAAEIRLPVEAKEDASSPKPAAPSPPPDDQLRERASDGLLVNGSVNNGATSPFAQFPAFGNNRQIGKGLYNGSLGLILDNSALDARSFSLTGQDTGKPAYNHLQAVAAFGGIFKIPHLIRNGPMFFVGYQWTRNRNATVDTALMPDSLQRAGDFSHTPGIMLPFPGNVIPPNRISPQATGLLNLYPLPNFTGSARYNYQIPVVGILHEDALESRLNKTINSHNQVYGSFAFQDSRAGNPNVFGFLDTVDTLGLNSTANWRHAFGRGLYANFGVQFSRESIRTIPFFENRQNISGAAGIGGNNQEPVNWGPPSLTFASGIAPLSDAQASFDRNQTSAVSASLLWIRGRHNVSLGADFRRQQFNYFSQQDPRGTFTFTGAATGSDFADFLTGVPDTSSIAFGNADKYFRQSAYDAFVTDDWRIGPELTLNTGLRWEYGAPITELYGRLVNLDVAPGFSAVAPVVAASPAGSLSGQRYPDSLIHPDKHGFQPRIGLSWRPFSGSSMIVRAGYGVYYNTSVYQNIALQMAQQSPLSKSLSVQNSPSDPLTLANGFNASPNITQNTFAIDPNFRIGYSQNWQISVQRDLPGSLVAIATYLGIKGTRGMQEFLPNTYPAGALNPCPTCPSGFAYMTSNGNSTRESSQLQIRRRLHNGITASLQYAYSKSIDDSALGGRNQGVNVIAQNWLDLAAERGLSTFDQRHLLTLQLQYTTGQGLHGGTLMGGWRGALFKEWTASSQITAGSGLPLTPVYLSAVSGTGVTGPIRPDYTGAPLYVAPPGLSLNPTAYTAPAAGQWGTAGRDSITGPSQFTFNASLGRTFRWRDRYNIDLRVDSTNALNHVTFTTWNTTINSAQFGLPTGANAMRSLQTTLRVRF